MNLSTKHSEQKSSLCIDSVKSNRIFLQSSGLTAFWLYVGCGIWAGSVKPDRMVANWLWLCCGGLIGVFSLKTAFWG